MTRLRSLILAFVAGAALAPPPPAIARELPLGPRSLDESRSVSSPAPGVTLTRIVRGAPGWGGPWRVNVLEVEVDVPVRVALSNDRVPGRVRVSAMARAAGAAAAVNGGFFGSTGPFDGDPVGALALGGRLVSEPVAGRAALLLPPLGVAAPEVAKLRFAGSVRIGGRRRLLDGVDRALGLIPGCGGRGGDLPTQRPGGGLVCSDPSELVLFSPSFGERTPPAGSDLEVVLEDGLVTSVRSQGGTRIPASGYVLTGSGEAAGFLRSTAAIDAQARVSLALRASGRTLQPEALEGIIGGGPRLVAAGRVRLRARAEGFDAAFAARNPRTLAGVKSDGGLLLVTVDGRQPRISVGVTLREAARVMRALGARDAMNLDGGGSTTMTIGRRVVNRPSDGEQRRVSDAILVAPR